MPTTPTPASAPHTAALLLPFASASAPGCRALGPQLATPHLNALLAELTLQHTDSGDDHSLSLPHERALAQALGLRQADGSAYGDGQIPWAAAAARQSAEQADEATTPQAWFTPCHFQVGMEQVTLWPANPLDLDEAQSRALFDALAPFCAEDGIHLHFESATRWHARGEALRGIACASLDRVTGRSVDAWLPESPANPSGAQLLKRLQSEAQMLFYTHPVNDAREAARQAIINGIWISGAGALAEPLAPHSPAQPTPHPTPHMPDTLRQAALRADWPAWQAAWAALDATAIPPLLHAARRGEPVTLILCGERSAQRWVNAPRSATARLGRLFKNLRAPAPAWKVLETL
jgi:hypothetical protein